MLTYVRNYVCYVLHRSVRGFRLLRYNTSASFLTYTTRNLVSCEHYQKTSSRYENQRRRSVDPKSQETLEPIQRTAVFAEWGSTYGITSQIGKPSKRKAVQV
jgi:hypothetical protein